MTRTRVALGAGAGVAGLLSALVLLVLVVRWRLGGTETESLVELPESEEGLSEPD